MDLDALKELTDRCLLQLYARARRILARRPNRRPAGWQQIERDGELAFSVFRERHHGEIYHYLLEHMHRQEAGEFHADFEDAIQQTFLEVIFWPVGTLHDNVGGLLCNNAWWRLCDLLKKGYGIRQATDPSAGSTRRRSFNNSPEGLLEHQAARPTPSLLVEEEREATASSGRPEPAAPQVDPRLRRLLDKKPAAQRKVLEAYYLQGKSIDEIVANRPDPSAAAGLYESEITTLLVDFARQVYQRFPPHEGERLLAGLLRAQQTESCRDVHVQAILDAMKPEERAIVERYCFQDSEMDELTAGAEDTAQARRRVNRTIFRFNQRVRAVHPDGERFLRNQVRGLRRQLVGCGLDPATLNALEEEFDRRPGQGRLRSQLLIELNRARTHLAEGRDAGKVQQRLERLLRRVRKG
jgi:DNA-directed RNA polymerase specialized sigma24 family protein